MLNRMETIKKKGFSMLQDNNDSHLSSFNPVDFSKIKVGIKNLDDAILDVGDFKKTNSRLGNKETVLQAIENQDLRTLREVSNFFYKTSGIYSRLCKYMAYMYRYDWMVTPYINGKSVKKEKTIDDFNKVLTFLDNFGVAKFLGETALKVFKNGCYYGYIIRTGDNAGVQELPNAYCRSRFTTIEGKTAVEFNMKYFDDTFRDAEQRMRMLKLFPKDFLKGYNLYKNGKLPATAPGEAPGWYLLDPDYCIKFSLNNEEFPPLISVIPAIINLDMAQGLERKKMEQQLLKIVIQKMPIDKNGDLVFDVDEAKDLHNNAVRMLGKAVGIDVLTTFADTEVEDMGSNSANHATDDSMDRTKSAVYDQAGVSQMQFNTDGNIALEKSLLNDEASMFNLIQQFENFLNLLLEPFNANTKKVFYRVQLLSTTIYNYKELSKIYKEQTQLGYSKVLPQIALGQSQSSILANAKFENEILELSTKFIPPMSSNTMNASVLQKEQINKNGEQKKENGRPKKADDEKAEKTIQNQEALS